MSMPQLSPIPIFIPEASLFSCKQLAHRGPIELTLKDVFLQIHCCIAPLCETIMSTTLLLPQADVSSNIGVQIVVQSLLSRSLL
jgi:hypothetical protein